ncbi:glycoside hydrolase family 76 protein [Amycolatopsis sp. 195334CR]|uniref:glycoside hydrolase family 76 protein n=1 Tax=Amycolatopsis sp. 195334CR TaxID=2814588 RepID=UPI001A8F1179|nr:glycoside hydrolase family 76 protein [Amycolatopsis sp. 195334CR]MBN6035808.1 fructose-bisphosphate aldolase [Amycolatopsis sp. 195334CR]
MTAAERAGEAENALRTRHFRRLWGWPSTVLSRSGWPADAGQRVHWHWNYWWQAHVLDCLVDAQVRAPSPERAELVSRYARTIKLRNFGRWTNEYYDDMAWLGIALERARRLVELECSPAVDALVAQLREGWTEDAGGGIWWRKNDQFKNAPANGPAAILHARVGDLTRARELFAWMDSRLVDPVTGLVWDGLRVDTGELVKHIYTYCQGVFLGTCLELSEVEAASRTVLAVAEHCAPGGVLRAQGGGDGGLFAGILARYLALAALRLEGAAAVVARELVLSSAEACYGSTVAAPGGPLFSPTWTEPVALPLVGGDPARDLSVQVGAWMLLEAAATLE